MMNTGVIQTVGEGFNPFSRQFRFENTNNDLPVLFGASFFNTSINSSGKTLPQETANLVNKGLHSPSTQSQFNDLAAELTQQVRLVQRDLRFTVDEHSGKTVIVVKDSQSGELVREIPSEKLRQLAQNLRNLQEQLDASTGHLPTLKGHLLDVHV